MELHQAYNQDTKPVVDSEGLVATVLTASLNMSFYMEQYGIGATVVPVSL